jgi:hypothetical protein
MLTVNAYRINLGSSCCGSYGRSGQCPGAGKAIERTVVLGRLALILPEALPETVLKNLPLRWRPPDIMNPVAQTKRNIILK